MLIFSQCLQYPVIFGGAPLDPEKKTKLDEAYGFLDKFLESSTYVAGNSVTLADIAIAATVSTAADVSLLPTEWCI